MVSNKSLWLLDEPTSSLDSDSSVLLKDIITEHTKFGGSVLVSSHSEFLDNIDFKIDLDNKNVSI
jgi:ABC-type transport system involved in cytochrome c biogenesis ATPase subunit